MVLRRPRCTLRDNAYNGVVAVGCKLITSGKGACQHLLRSAEKNAQIATIWYKARAFGMRYGVNNFSGIKS